MKPIKPLGEIDPRLMPHTQQMADTLRDIGAKLGPQSKRPGRPGMISRMQMTFFASLGQCVAGERDHGSSDRDIFDCLPVAIADTLVSACYQRCDEHASERDIVEEFERMLATLKARGVTIIKAPVSDDMSAAVAPFRSHAPGRG